MLAALALVGAPPALARPLAIPIRVDDAFLREQLVSQLFHEPGERTPPWRDATGCTSVVLSKPAISRRDGALHVVAHFDAKLGVGTGGFCVGELRRQGLLDAALEARVDPGRPIVAFRVVRSDLLDADGARRFAGALWDALRGLIHPHLDTLRLDFHGPVEELRAFLPALLPDADAARVQELCDSLALADLSVLEDAIEVELRLDVPDPEPRAEAQPTPEPALSPEELARWEAAWQSWDAFLTFLIKHGGRRSDDALRRELRETLLDARHDIAAILAPTAPREADPVRPLFLATWERLAPLLRRVTTGLPGEEALQYLTLIAAADAYGALEQLGPEYGIELSRDGMRRMARMIEPAPLVDPTAWDEAVDTELRDLFGFGPPLAGTSGAEDASEGDVPEPGAMAPPKRHPRGTRAAIALAAAPDERPLDVWVPTRSELAAYLSRVRDLLGATSLFVQRKKVLPGEHVPLFRSLVLATAWQETCWRQYVRRRGEVRPITSPVGALGIMQVNPHVWRGFYDVKALGRDTRYNAEAGSEILHHYLVDYAIAKREDQVRGQPEDLARAAYAAYNAGPRQLTRYRRPGNAEGGVGHRIDADFWTKYQEVRAGNDLAVQTCYPGFST